LSRRCRTARSSASRRWWRQRSWHPNGAARLLFLLMFANAFFLLARHQPGSFNCSLSRTDALYFVVTVFATVGFGDIVPVSPLARVIVTAQMIGDLLVLGVALKVILLAVRRRSG
ncbi:potassium channel family protein, partial [Lentzea sp. NPDC006480]|uniref:potassium channel family protein n=1 Tax=Lentzea sp. NPDC006480 TaxID=3157176 RepID=UPI0033A20AD2